MTAPDSTASMHLEAYLDRIGYSGSLAPSADTLAALQQAHLYAVPFENLDIGLGRRLSLALPALYDKIVTRRRGGFCYELNGLFAWLLSSLGYKVTHLSARVAEPGGSFGPEFDHLTLLVQGAAGSPAGEGWLADVGFGDGFMQPLRLEAGEQPQGQWVYGLDEQDGGWRLWRRDASGAVEPQYAFTLQPREFAADFETMCLWQQTAPESHFVQHRLATLATPTGRITLSDRRWIVTEHGQKREQAIDEAEFWHRARTDFGMPLADVP
jgi:N-hydroxyarylamine O-acetyltransferase